MQCYAEERFMGSPVSRICAVIYALIITINRWIEMNSEFGIKRKEEEKEKD